MALNKLNLDHAQQRFMNGRCLLFAGRKGEILDGYLAYKGRFRDRATAKDSCATNGYDWGQIVVWDGQSLWCAEDYGIDRTVAGWRVVNLDEPYKRL